MITKLTEEQEAKMPEYVKKWIEIGISNDRLDYDSTSDIVSDFRNIIGMKTGVPLVIVNNPIEAWVTCCLHESGVDIKDYHEEMVKVFSGNPENRDIPQAALPYQTGSFFASVFSFYDYFLNEVDIEIDPELRKKYFQWQKTCEIGCIYPLEDVTVVCQKPLCVHLNENNVAHKDGSAAIEYDGLGDFKIYSLNGVTVPEWLAVTPAQDIDIEKYNLIENADVKAEFVRKVGIERFLNQGTKIDSYDKYDQEENPWWWESEYELYDMNFLFESLEYAPYLKMTNPTTKVFHVEGVSPQCGTLKDALRERFGGKEMRIVGAA
jgi:hypothetical protein